MTELLGVSRMQSVIRTDYTGAFVYSSWIAMKKISLNGSLLFSNPALASAQSSTTLVTNVPPLAAHLGQRGTQVPQTAHDPWDVVPPMVPYRNLADEVKATSKPGQASPLNPNCEGKTDDAIDRRA